MQKMQSKKELHRGRPPPLKIARTAGQGPTGNHGAGGVTGTILGAGHALHNAVPQFRQPLIIHTYSPEVIKTDIRDFRQLVQRLTGSETADEQQAADPAGLQGRKRPRSEPAPEHPAEQPEALHPSIQSNSYAKNQADLSLVKDDPESNPASSESTQAMPLPHPHSSGQRSMNPALDPAAVSHYPGQQRNPAPELTQPMSVSGSLASTPKFNYDLSPSVLPSPSQFALDLPSLRSPLFPPLSPLSRFLQSSGNHNYSPGPFSAAGNFMSDLPLLSPAAYSWHERNGPGPINTESTGSYAARPPLPPPPIVRQPPTTTANFFPVTPPPRPL